MAATSRNRLISSSARLQGCWMRRRCVNCVRTSALAQKRRVATSCFRLERSRRYRATTPAEMAPASPSNSPRLRLRNDMLLQGPAAHQGSENGLLDRGGGGYAHVPSVIAQGHSFQM